MVYPVACFTVSGSARRTLPPVSVPSFRSSTRFAPEAITRSGLLFTVKTSDFAIWPTATPRASAACWEVRASTGSSITWPVKPSAPMADRTFSTAGFIRSCLLEKLLERRPSQLGERGQVDSRGAPRAAPSIPIERDVAAPDAHALLLQQHPLRQHAAHVGADTDSAARIHHPMPG